MNKEDTIKLGSAAEDLFIDYKNYAKEFRWKLMNDSNYKREVY